MVEEDIRTFWSYALLVSDQGCFGGNDAGGSFSVDDRSSEWRERKSLYRLDTVHERIGVATGLVSMV